MKIITKKKAQVIEQDLAEILAVYSEIQMRTDALGSGTTRAQKLRRLYKSTADLAYMVEGIKGLNKVITAFFESATTMDDVVTISQTHLEVMKKYETNTVLFK